LFENGVGHIREKGVGRLLENSGLIVGHFPENSQPVEIIPFSSSRRYVLQHLSLLPEAASDILQAG